MQMFLHSWSGRRIAMTGLLAALILGLLGTCVMQGRNKLRLAVLDARAQPFFDEARGNIPEVVRKLTGTGALCKLGWYMARDKLCGSHRAQDYLTNTLRDPIMEPCRKGALVYGCNCDSSGFLNTLTEINGQYAVTQAYAVSGLAMEAIFLKTTVTAVRSVCGAVISRLAGACGSGAACALADGPFPIGDAIGALLAVGGTVWCVYDLYKAKTELPQELTAVLEQAIQDWRTACRKEALK